MKIFSGTSRSSVFVYMGIPYAEPPIGVLRFLPPTRHRGWPNRTLYARGRAPSCPTSAAGVVNNKQLTTSEDCLYLDVWTPGLRQGSPLLPVVVLLADQPLDGALLASEGNIVVVNVNSRKNVFGFLCLEGTQARGNAGLLDEYFALLWIRENLAAFGGDVNRVTLMGHSSGADDVLRHMASPRTAGLFHRVIVMSGGGLSKTTNGQKRNSSPSIGSLTIAQSLGCPTGDFRRALQCLKQLDKDDLLRAYEEIYQGGNRSNLPRAVVDDFLQENERYLPQDPKQVFENGDFVHLPILIGITSMESANMNELWNDLSSQGQNILKRYIHNTAIPSLLEKRGLRNHPRASLILSAIKWRYDLTEDSRKLLHTLRTMEYDAEWSAPHEDTLRILSRATSRYQTGRQNTRKELNIYAYIFDEPGLPDLRGIIGNFSGAGHGTDLAMIMGTSSHPSYRGVDQHSERFARKTRLSWINFIKNGDPNIVTYDTWRHYTLEDTFEMLISSRYDSVLRRRSEDLDGQIDDIVSRHKDGARFWNILIRDLAKDASLESSGSSANGDNNVEMSALRHGVFSLLGLVVILLAILAVCLVILRRNHERDKINKREREF